MKNYVYSFGRRHGRRRRQDERRPRRQGRGARGDVAAPAMPVPPGFTISTEVCNIYFENGNKVPDEINQQILKALAKLEKQHRQEAGRRRRIRCW